MWLLRRLSVWGNTYWLMTYDTLAASVETKREDVDPNRPDKYGRTPLGCAAIKGHEIMWLLRWLSVLGNWVVPIGSILTVLSPWRRVRYIKPHKSINRTTNNPLNLQQRGMLVCDVDTNLTAIPATSYQVQS